MDFLALAVWALERSTDMITLACHRHHKPVRFFHLFNGCSYEIFWQLDDPIIQWQGNKAVSASSPITLLEAPTCCSIVWTNNPELEGYTSSLTGSTGHIQFPPLNHVQSEVARGVIYIKEKRCQSLTGFRARAHMCAQANNKPPWEFAISRWVSWL